MRGFRAGFRHRSLLVLVAALLLLPLGLLGFEKLFTSGAWTAVPLKYWISDTFDSFTYVSWGAGALKLRPPAKPLVVLVGGSSARESIWSGEALANEIELAGGPDVAGRSLAGPHQSLGGSLAIIDNLPNTPTTVLYGINFHRLGGGMKQQFKQIDGRELLLKSETLRRFAAERSAEYRRSYSILPGIFQSLATRASALGSSVAQGRGLLITYDVHSTDRKPDLTPVELAKVNRWINSPSVSAGSGRAFRRSSRCSTNRCWSPGVGASTWCWSSSLTTQPSRERVSGRPSRTTRGTSVSLR